MQPLLLIDTTPQHDDGRYSDDVRDLVSALLSVNPDHRPTASEAMAGPMLAEWLRGAPATLLAEGRDPVPYPRLVDPIAIESHSSPDILKIDRTDAVAAVSPRPPSGAPKPSRRRTHRHTSSDGSGADARSAVESLALQEARDVDSDAPTSPSLSPSFSVPEGLHGDLSSVSFVRSVKSASPLWGAPSSRPSSLRGASVSPLRFMSQAHSPHQPVMASDQLPSQHSHEHDQQQRQQRPATARLSLFTQRSPSSTPPPPPRSARRDDRRASADRLGRGGTAISYRRSLDDLRHVGLPVRHCAWSCIFGAFMTTLELKRACAHPPLLFIFILRFLFKRIYVHARMPAFAHIHCYNHPHAASLTHLLQPSTRCFTHSLQPSTCCFTHLRTETRRVHHPVIRQLDRRCSLLPTASSTT
jgi:hypothetical protein